jgi:hypothetical protein
MTVVADTSPVTGVRLFRAKLLSGGWVDLQGQEEFNYYLEAQNRYMTEFQFTVASDLRTLDRLIFFETVLFRWQGWLACGYSYNGPLTLATENQVRRSIKDTTSQVSQLQQDLGLTFSQRQRDQYESVGAYILKLKQAAKEFGVHREKQLTVALDLFYQVLSVAGTWLRSDENERRKLGHTDPVEILKWIDGEVREKFDEVDKEFQTRQISYVREL